MRHAARIKVKTPRPKTPPPVRRQGKAVGVARPMLVQPALQVGSVSDPAEREAEVMAARVVGGAGPSPAPADAAPPSDTGRVAPLRRSAEDQPNLDDLQPEPATGEQADFDLPTNEDVAPDGLKAADMSELESGRPADTGGTSELSALRRAGTPEAVVGRSGGAAPGDVAAHVANPGPGRPLPSGLRARVEPHFGQSFEEVRLHDGPADQDAAARIGARAFTHKNRIWLGRGESATNTRLMAHELTHVVQQTKGSDALPLERTPLRRDDDEGILEGKLEGYARHVPGYTLATVILGKTLISGRKVLKTAENLLGGIFGLHPLGTALFDKLRETKMVAEAFDWVGEKLSELNLTWSRVRGIIDKIWDAPLVGAVDYVIDLFKPITRDLISFAKAVGKKVLEFAVRGALKLAGPYADKVWAIIQQAGEVLDLILSDPLGFAKNLVKAVVGGFGRFAKNILDHLKKGLLGWIFGAIASAGITMPERLDFKGLMSLVMQILGLTYAAFRKQLVKKLGPSGERKVTMIEKSVEIVKILLKEGFAGIWRKMLELIENFKTTLIGGMTEMVITTVVKVGLSWLAGLSNPVGAVVKVVLSIYDLIVAFLERLEQIMDVAKSIFSSVGAIARGQVEAASKFVEETIGRTVPVVLAFLAAVLGLNSIPSKIQKVIRKLQKPVQKAMGKLIGFVVKKAKKLWSKLIKKLNGKRKLPSYPFKVGQKDHRIFAKSVTKKKVDVYIASEEHQIDKVEAASKKEVGEVDDKVAKAMAKTIVRSVAKADDTTEDDAKKVDLTNKKKNMGFVLKNLNADLKTAAKDLTAVSDQVDENASLDEHAEPPALFRAKEPRSEEHEGKWEKNYKDMADLKKTPIQTGSEIQMSKFYEMDHTIEKQFPKTILENLKTLKTPLSDEEVESGKDTQTLRAGEKREKRNKDAGREKKKDAYAPDGADPIGRLGAEIKQVSENADYFPAIAIYQRNHVKQKGKGLPSALSLVKAARKEGPDKAFDHVRRGLKTQLAAELAEIRQVYNKDPNASDGIKARVTQSLDQIEAWNNAIYDLQAVEANAPKPVPDEIGANSGSDFPFAGLPGNAMPNFAQVEGVGDAYSERQDGWGDFLEYDHILDKALPKDAAKAKTLSKTQAGEVAGRAEELATGATGSPAPLSTADRGKKIKSLKSRALFVSGEGVKDYTDDTGYAIPLYLPLANQVTSRAGGIKKFTATPPEMSSAIKESFARFAAFGDESDYQSGRTALHDKVAERLRERTAVHGRHVADVYSKQVQYVTEINDFDPAAQARAKREMQKIIRNLAASLGRAREATETLVS